MGPTPHHTCLHRPLQVSLHIHVYRLAFLITNTLYLCLFSIALSTVIIPTISCHLFGGVPPSENLNNSPKPYLGIVSCYPKYTWYVHVLLAHLPSNIIYT